MLENSDKLDVEDIVELDENFEVFKVDEASAGTRIDILVAEKLGLSRSKVQKMIVDGHIVVTDNRTNNTIVHKNYKVFVDDRIVVENLPDVENVVMPEDIPVSIIYEDDDLLVVDKPAGMVVHPGAGNYAGTLVNALLYHFGDNLSTIGGMDRPGIVHRIDKETSGAIIIAKNDATHENLALQLRNRTMLRQYECVVYGRIKELCGEINIPIGRHPVNRTMMKAFSENEILAGNKAKEALSKYETVEVFGSYSHLKVKLQTGRTHQIRVHLTKLGYPVAGDIVYGAKIGGKNRAKFEKCLTGQCLHASTLGFIHPKSGDYIEIASSLPEEFLDFLHKVERVE